MPMPTEPTVPLSELELFCNGLDHSEGICVTAAGTIYVGGEAGQIYRVEDDGTPTEVHSTDGFLLGLACDAHGAIYAVDVTARCVWRVGLEARTQERFFEGLPDRPARQPNWGAFDADGNYYLSDSGDWGARNGLIWVRRAGGAVEVFTEESCNFPNGMAVSADSRTLWVAESYPSALVRYAIGEDGTAGPREHLLDLGLAVPDGVALCEDGSVLLSCYRPDTVFRWTPDGDLETYATDPRGTAIAAPTNIVFTGPGRNELVMPNLGRWHLTRIRSTLVGVPLHYPTRAQIDAVAGPAA